MIIFETIRWKNFLSTGNVFTEVNLNDDKTNLIVGKNGAGKSTILDALTFSLFGKPFRKINKPMLVNSINEKDCIVEIEFRIGKNEYKVVRGIKPAKFEIYHNGQLWNQESTVIDQQKNFEQNVLKMNYKSFTQIVVLGSSTFVPFMRLPVASRREIIEDILDIQIFSVMNQNLKEKIKVGNTEIRDLDYNIDILKEKKSIQEKHITEVQKKNTVDILNKEEKLKFLVKEKEDLKNQAAALLMNLEDVNKSIALYAKDKSERVKVLKQKGNIELKVAQFRDQHNFFTEKTTCPTCSQHISENIKKEKLEEIISAVNVLRIEMTEVQNEVVRFEEREKHMFALTDKVGELTTDLAVNNKSQDHNNAETINIESELKSLRNLKTETNEAQETLNYYIAELQKMESQYASSKEEMDCLATASQLLKDSGIKSRIIKKYLPVMNKLIAQYLQNMDFYVDFSLDENFEETIKSRYRDVFSYESFSEGEKARIDIALLLTWRSVAKLKNSVDTNLLILDEIFDGSLDQSGGSELGWILRNFDDNTNVFVISHRESMNDKFDKTFTFEKVKNYSVLTAT